jgi:autotransporter passenger strand-loop-strand repeat protein
MASFIASNGQTETGLTVSGGEQGVVLFGGTAVDITVLSGGEMEVLSGGQDSNTVLSGGSAFLLGGTAIDTTISSGGNEIISNGGVASASTVGSGGSQTIASGGIAVFTLVSSGGVQTVSGHANDTLLSGGKEIVASGAVASGTVVQSGGVETVQTSAADGFTVVSRGGTEIVFGDASFATISAGGSEKVSSGGALIGATVMSGGTLTVFKGGVANFTLVSAFGGYEYISAGGTAIGTTLSGAGQEMVLAGGLSVSTTMATNGIDSEVIASGGTGSGTNLGAGNFQYVLAGGSAVGTEVGATSTEYVAGRADATQVSAGGALQVSSGGTADFAQISAGGALAIASGGSATGTTILSGGTEFVSSGAHVSGTTLSAGAAIDISYLAYFSGGSAAVVNNLLTINEGGATYTQTLSGSYIGEYFQPSNDGNGGTLITVSGTPCYCRGTHILTDQGEIAVERLKIGDRLMTHAGLARPVMWIGRRSYARSVGAGNHDVLPIRICAGALADGIPHRDLFISPMHAMYLDHVLIPASALVNGRSIVQVDAGDRVDYFHLELESHDIIFAEGAPSESFVDDESRGMFDNAAEYRVSSPRAERPAARYCAPRVEGGELLESVRRGLANRAQTTRSTLRLQGRLDLIERGRISGWACDEVAPDHPVQLGIFDNDVAIGEIVADGYRPDLAAAGYGDGHHAFEFVVPGGLSPALRHRIDVRSVAGGQSLPNSPQFLEPLATVVTEAAVAHTYVTQPESPCRGSLDIVTRERIAGWAQDHERPDASVALQILDKGVLITRVLANRYRPDLAAAGIGQGWHSFDLDIPGGLSAMEGHVIEVRRERDGKRLGEPVSIAAANSFDAGLEQTVAQAVSAVAADCEQERVLSFMLTQTDRLRQQRADVDAQRGVRRNSALLRRRYGLRAADTEPGRRALVIDQRVPELRRDGGSVALLSHMRALKRLGYSVSFVAATEDDAAAALCEAGITHCRAPFYTSVEDVLRRQAGCFDVVYLHRVDIAARYLALARTYAPTARILYSVADLHHLRLRRQAEIEFRPELLAESRRLRLAECTAAWSADAVISHSPVEVEMLRQAVPEAQVYHVPWDVLPAEPTTEFANRMGVALIGNYAHAPNVDAAHFLVESVMPLVWQVDPGITCRLVGREMPKAVRSLARPGVTIVGEVDDLRRQVIDQVRLSLAPLRYGAGIKAKVLESFAAGLPCVMSDIAAEGLPLSSVLRQAVGGDAASLAAAICHFHADEAAHHAAVVAGQSLIRAHFSADLVTAALELALAGGKQDVVTCEPANATLLTESYLGGVLATGKNQMRLASQHLD